MEEIYKKVENILKTKAKKYKLLAKDRVLNSVAKSPKKQLHIYGKNDVIIGKRPIQKTYVAGVMLNKNTVGFYSMAVYAFPKEFKLSPEIKKLLRGKSCFQIKNIDKKLEKEISDIVEKNIKIFKKEGWI